MPGRAQAPLDSPESIAMNTSIAATSNSWADPRGFLPPVSFDKVRSDTLPPKGPKQSGYYLLGFDDDTYYVGESVDLRSRMGGHSAKWGTEISSVRLLPQTASKQELRKYETFLTRELEAIGIPLRNVLNASVTAGQDALDELLPDSAQDEWSRDPRGFNSADDTPLKEMTAQEVRYSTAARRYSEAPRSEEVTSLLETYLELCVPAPRATEFQYWGVSTGTYAGTRFPWRFCVNVGKMETFVVHEDKQQPGELIGFVNLRESALFSTPRSKKEFGQRHPGASIRNAQYADAGVDTVQVSVSGIERIARLLTDRDVTAAAGRLVLDLMRKHFCVYTRYHCPQLVQMAYPDYPRPAARTPELAIAYADQGTLATSPGEIPIEIAELGDVDHY